ncbi:LytTR family transcriptional regulator DNA-binding domain-containing protein [Streptococcus himalayensis]|uniref:HTH LytTR-type domain-containing protein n=1 Tax=Streptococcus himalayensis TaxID=1888195 RepID=A0A917ECW8_9STRE|nr:hypothetical protein [Streptococcus himalayensis]GGE23277.1 hypothetical protein GCM10011510_00400 [Streptococcus himalayensis]
MLQKQDIHVLELKGIFHIAAKDKVVSTKTKDKSYRLEKRIYPLTEVPSKTFLYISQSEISDHEKIRSLFYQKWTDKNLFDDGDPPFSSPCYLTSGKALDL